MKPRESVQSFFFWGVGGKMSSKYLHWGYTGGNGMDVCFVFDDRSEGFAHKSER